MVNKKINIICILVLLIGVMMAGVNAEDYHQINMDYDKGAIKISNVIRLESGDEIYNIHGKNKIIVLDQNNKNIYERNFKVPNIKIIDYMDKETGDITGGEIIEEDNVSFSILIPYNEEARKIEVYGENDELLATYSINDGIGKSAKNLYIPIIIIILIVAVIISYNIMRRFNFI